MHPEKINPMLLKSIGVVKRQGKQAILEILPQYAPALEGLAGFSHVWVLYWFHEHDNPAERAILKVSGNTVEVADLDAHDGSPILDLKPYIPKGDSLPDAATPDWVKKLRP